MSDYWPRELSKVGASVLSYVELSATEEITVFEAVREEIFKPKKLSASVPSITTTCSKDPQGTISATND